MCFRSATEGQKAFREMAARIISPYSEARKPEWQRIHGRLESGKGASIGEEKTRGSLRSEPEA